jgi:hypothetical protein
MNIWSTLITNSQPAELVKPSESAFDNPAVNTQTAAVLRATLGQHRSNAKLAQRLTVGLRVVSTITLNTVRTLTRPTTLTSNRRNSFNQWQKLCNIMTIGTGDFHRQRDAACICNQMVFGARFASISGIWAGFRPPKTARTDPESTSIREKSILSMPRSLLSKTRCILSQTPAFCQSLNRRQQVMPLPQPISLGRYSQGMPVLSTNKMPLRAARSEMGFRPGYRNLLFFFGISGSMSFHNSSLNIGLAMSNLLVFVFYWLLMLSVISMTFLSFC